MRNKGPSTRKGGPKSSKRWRSCRTRRGKAAQDVGEEIGGAVEISHIT